MTIGGKAEVVAAGGPTMNGPTMMTTMMVCLVSHLVTCVRGTVDQPFGAFATIYGIGALSAYSSPPL